MSAVVILAGAQAACGRADGAGLWRDDFRNVRGLESARQLVKAEGGGISVSSALQTWEIPGGTPFSAGVLSPGLGVRKAPGSAREFLSLSQEAETGDYRSPVLDTFSARTRWETIEWETDENSSARDATCKCASPGSPLTPVVLTYGLSGATEVTCAIPVSRSREEAGSELIRAPAAARYLRIRAHLYGRKAAAEVDLDLGTGAEAAPDVLGLRPALKKIRATYYARAAHAVSKPIAPESVGTWGELAFDADTPGRSSVSIDVLDESGELLLSEVSSGADLAGIINPFEHPALRLRARLEIAVENPEERPLLRSWGLSWKPTGERLRLDRTVLDRGKGESVRGMVCVEKNGVLTIRVHDVKGRMVNLLARQWVPARAQVFAWNGLARAGERVPDGRYFITASTAGGAATRSLVVR